jgi:hypothetical protein
MTGFVAFSLYKRSTGNQEDDSMLTHHAEIRMQQRGISMEAVDTLLGYGHQRRHRGADIYYLDKRARSLITRALGKDRYRQLEKSLDSYLVVGDDGTVITAAHRHHRLRF